MSSSIILQTQLHRRVGSLFPYFHRALGRQLLTWVLLFNSIRVSTGISSILLASFLWLQDGCCSSRHHVCIQRRKKGEKNATLITSEKTKNLSGCLWPMNQNSLKQGKLVISIFHMSSLHSEVRVGRRSGTGLS